jgi:hypothetical protein
MNATPEPHGPVQPDLEAHDHEDDGFGETLPVRPRRPFLTKWSAGLMALTLGGIGFYVGVRVEKSKFPSTTGSGAGAFAALRAGFGGTSTTGGTGTTAGGLRSRTGTGGSGSFAGGGGFAAAFGGAGSNATIGSISSVSGRTIYVTGTSGNTVKVKLSSQTTITKSESVRRSKIYPGDEVVIEGASGKGGTVTATSVTDSGARSTGTGASSSTGGSGTSSSSVVSSLFGGG